MEYLDVNDVRMALKELVIGLNSSSPNFSTPEEVKDYLLHLEEIDETFHKYSLIKMIRSSVEDALGEIIDKELNRSEKIEDDLNRMFGLHTNEPGFEERITQSTQYKNLFDCLSLHMMEAESDLKKNFDAELLPFLLDVPNDVDSNDISTMGRSYSCLKIFGGGSKKTEILYSACDSPADDSSSSQDTAMFLTNDSLVEIASNLNKKNSIELRQSALRSLLINSSVLDLPHAVWPPIREELLEILLNLNGILWVQALKIIARGLNGTSPSCAKEMFQLLVDLLIAQFQEMKDSNGGYSCENEDDGCSEKGINISEEYIEKMIKAFQLLAQYIQQLSQKPTEKNTPDSFKELLLLLSKNSQSCVGLTPFQFFSLVDPSATWFTRAMHGSHTRGLMVQLIGENKHLLICCVQHCMDHSSQIRNNLTDTNNSPTNQSLSNNAIRNAENHSIMMSIKIVAGLIACTGGRELFPVTTDNNKEVTLQEFVTILVKIFLLSPLSGHASSPSDFPLKVSSKSTTCSPDTFSLSLECLKKLCQVEESSRTCMCHPEVIQVLLEPIIYWLDEKTYEASKLTKILRSCIVIDLLAFTQIGKKALISSTNGGSELVVDAGSKMEICQVPAKAIVTFVMEAINFNLKERAQSKSLMKSILGRLLRILRALSNSCKGINLLAELQFHVSLAAAHALALQEIENLTTPTPDSLEREKRIGPPASTNEKETLMGWEATLNDTLLNLLITPRGLGLISRTGVLKDCVYHMCQRCKIKSQVSTPSEKLNYRFISSQISTTPVGMTALSDCGFVTFLINNLWSTIETSADITPPSVDSFASSSVYHSQSSPTASVVTKYWSPCCIEKFSAKPFYSLSNVLCSYSSLSKLLLDQNLPSKTSGTRGKFMPPQTLVGLLDRLVIVHTDFKIRSLYSYEESHHCGLRLINLLSCCLDTFCLIQCQYDVTRILLSCQKENVTHENSKETIIDSLSVLRNHILVRCYLLGGSNERVLPSKDFSFNFHKTIKFFWEYPVPDCYMLKTNRKYGTEVFLTPSSIKCPNNWTDFKKSIIEILMKNPGGVKDDIVVTLLEQSVDYWLTRKGETPGNDVTNIPSSAAKRFSFSKIQTEGMNLITRYGRNLKLLNVSGKELMERLKVTVAKISMALKRKFKLEARSATSSDHSGSGFDWLLACIFLMSNGNANRVIRLLTRLSFLPLSISYWSQHLACMATSGSSCATDQNIGSISSVLNHNFEIIMQNELPQVYSAFKLSGFAPGHILQHWIRQCFLNYLDWSHIQQYIVTCICLGPDYSIYFTMAILKHLDLDIKNQMANQNLNIFLREEPIRNFQLDQQIPFMLLLEEKYRTTFLKDLTTCLEELKK